MLSKRRRLQYFKGETMKKIFRTLAVVAAFSMCSVGAATAADVTWRVPTSVPEGSPFYQNFLERFASNVKTITSGRVEIQPFGAGVIVPALKVFDAVRDGVVEAGHSTSSYLVNQDPENAIFSGFPGGMGPDAYKAWLYQGGGQEKLQAMRAKQGLKTMIVGGVDATQDALAAMQAGDLKVTVFQDAAGQGAGALDAALKLAKGEKVEHKVYIPFQLVTPANIDKFLKKN